MAATYGWAMLRNPYPSGLDETQRNVVVTGQLLPIETDVQNVTSPTSFAIATNVLTFQVTNNYTTGGSQSVVVFGATGSLAYINGTYTTSSATASTLVVPLTHANVSATALSNVTIALSAPYATGGLALAGFVDSSLKTDVIGGIGPNAVNNPKAFFVYSINGSSRTYPVNLTTSPVQVLSFSGTTQATNGTLVPTDMIGFQGEWVKDGF